MLEWYEKMIVESDLHLSAEEKSHIEARLWSSIRENTLDAETAIQEPVPAPAKLVWFRRKWVAAAAIVLLLTGGVWYWKSHDRMSENTLAGVPDQQGLLAKVNDGNGQSRVVLEDSTVIVLEPRSGVYYAPKPSGGMRAVYLTGSAFFLVKHDPNQRFVVHVGQRLTTEVLGTSFHILQDTTANRIEVRVVTGKVCVYPQQTTEGRIILTRNKKVVFNAVTNEFVTGLVDSPQPVPVSETSDETAAASDNRFVFEDEPLNKVLEVMSKAYGLTITTESEKLARLHFTGNITKYDLYKQLDIICQSTKCTYEVDGEKIILRKKL